MNKLLIKGCFWHPFILFLLLFPVSLLSAQDISKYYQSSSQSNGVLYFFGTDHTFESTKGNANLDYDLTYLSTGDSITFNFTFIDETIRDIDSLSLDFENHQEIGSAKKLFIESKRSKWIHRYSTQLHYNEVESFVNEEDSPLISLYYNGNDKLSLRAKKSSWKKQSAILAKIIMMINVNKS